MLVWRDKAACRGLDPELFFPISENGLGAAQLAAAQQVCSSCPVRLACLGWALQHNIGYGVWGGMGETVRRRVRQQTAAGRAAAARLSANGHVAADEDRR